MYIVAKGFNGLLIQLIIYINTYTYQIFDLFKLICKKKFETLDTNTIINTLKFIF